MIFYHRTVYHSGLVRSRFAEVVCDKCGCRYSYVLARIGAASSSSPQDAAKLAECDAAWRLAVDVELVPCPKCRWVNEKLVHAYRTSQVRGLLRLAVLFGVVGTMGSLIVGWAISYGPAHDRELGSKLSFIGPVLSLSIAGFLIFRRWSLWARVRPNEDADKGGEIPRGTPPAMILDAETGTMTPPRSTRFQESRPGVWVDVQLGRVVIPPICCGCLSPTVGAEYRVSVRKPVDIVFPLCRGCWWGLTYRQFRGALLAAGLGSLGGILLHSKYRLEEFNVWLVIGVLASFAAVAGAVVANRLEAPIRVKVVDRFRGVVSLLSRVENYPL